MPIMGHQISQAMLDALGLPKHVTAFSLHVRAGDIMTVDCEYYPDDLPAVEKALASYTLEHRRTAEFYDRVFADAEGKRAAEIGFDAWMRERTARAHAEYMARHAAGGIDYN